MSFVSFTNWRFAYLTVAPILAKADKLEPLIRPRARGIIFG